MTEYAPEARRSLAPMPEPWRNAEMADGLWAVVNPGFVAGFTIEKGVVTMCAPILRGRLSYWMTQARWVCP